MSDDSHDDNRPDDPRDQAQATHDDLDAERGGIMESLMPKLVKKVIIQGIEALGDEKMSDTVVADVVRKAINKGNEVVDVTEESVRRLVGELPLAKEVADRVAGRLDDYRSEIIRVLSDEMRGFFERVDLGAEIQKALTSMSLEISTEIKFVPKGDSADDSSKVKPVVKSKSRVKRKRTPNRTRDE